MDLSEITQRWKEATQQLSGSATSGKITYNYTNIFVEAPKAACEDRTVKPDTTIQVQMSSPTE